MEAYVLVDKTVHHVKDGTTDTLGTFFEDGTFVPGDKAVIPDIRSKYGNFYFGLVEQQFEKSLDGRCVARYASRSSIKW